MLIPNFFLVDIDGDGSAKEIVYLNKHKNRIIALELGETPGKVRFNFDVVEKLSPRKEYDFQINKMAAGSVIEIGDNMIFFGPSESPRIESGLFPINGVWSEWSEWYSFSNGSTCSKVCGDGMEIRTRMCNSPAPRNGGDQCAKETIEGRFNVGVVDRLSCRLRDCLQEECNAGEIFDNGSCDPDPNADDDGGVGGTGGLNDDDDSGGDDDDTVIVEEPGDCTSNEVFEPHYHRCVRAYVYNDIFLEVR